MTLKKPCVLVVDDDARIQRMMQMIAELEGYRTVVAADGKSAIEAFVMEQPDLVLLDVMMPDMDGYEACRRIREMSSVPIIMVTAKGQDDDKVAGLDAGADDYVPKPFSSVELAARMRAVLRRSKPGDEGARSSFRCGELSVFFTDQKATLGTQDLDLTATEYKVLSILAQNAGRVLTPDQILEKVWGESYLGEINLLQVNIARLRQKLGEEARNPRYICTRRGLGYMMRQE